MNQKIVEIFATGFYFGKSKFAPGTFGTLWGIPLAFILVKLTALLQASALAYMLVTFALILLASWIAQLHENFTNAHDPGEIVIDEVVGYLVTFTLLPMTWQSFLAAFLFFRLFDIWKPWPIRYIDQKVKGGLGTVLDDVAAGIFANICLQIIFEKTNWLGVQFAG